MIRPVAVFAGKEGTLDAWEAAAKKSDANFSDSWEQLRSTARGNQDAPYLHWSRVDPRAPDALLPHGCDSDLADLRDIAVPSVRTDAEGRFTLNGVGRDRVVELLVAGKGIETTSLYGGWPPGPVFLRAP